jgi:hypothetical protein
VLNPDVPVAVLIMVREVERLVSSDRLATPGAFRSTGLDQRLPASPDLVVLGVVPPSLPRRLAGFVLVAAAGATAARDQHAAVRLGADAKAPRERLTFARISSDQRRHSSRPD